MSHNLPEAQLIALADCREYSAHNGYYWKPKTMEKLAERGLVEKRSGRPGFGPAYFITQAGREALSPTAPSTEQEGRSDERR